MVRVENLSLLLRLREDFAACQVLLLGAARLISILLDSCFGCDEGALDGGTTASAGELQGLGFTESGEGRRVHTPVATVRGQRVNASPSVVRSSVLTQICISRRPFKELSEASLGTLCLKLQDASPLFFPSAFRHSSSPGGTYYRGRGPSFCSGEEFRL